MLSIAREAVPEDSLLKTHRGALHPERWGNYGDCFSIRVDRAASLADFVFAFYTSPLFRIERLLLRVLAGARAGDGDAYALAQGSAAKFSIWYTGERSATQLLMCDRYERTRSWFRVVPLEGGGCGTRTCGIRACGENFGVESVVSAAPAISHHLLAIAAVGGESCSDEEFAPGRIILARATTLR